MVIAITNNSESNRNALLRYELISNTDPIFCSTDPFIGVALNHTYDIEITPVWYTYPLETMPIDRFVAFCERLIELNRLARKTESRDLLIKELISEIKSIN